MQYKIIIQHIKKNFPVYILLFLGILFFRLRGEQLWPDAAWYVNNGFNIFQGKGYVDESWSPVLIRGPVFPFLINIFYRIFGVSVESAFWVVRFFNLLNVLLIYWLGKRLFNRTIGFFAALLLIFSSAVHCVSSHLYLDNVMPFFIFAALYFTYRGLEKAKWLFFIFSGMTWAAAYLTKELTVLFIPVPFLLWLLVNRYRNKNNFFNIALLYFTVFICILPWILYINNVSGSLKIFFGRGAPKVYNCLYDISSEKSIINVIKNYILFFKNYFQQFLYGQINISILIVISWLYVGYKSFIKWERRNLFILLPAVMFLPIILFQGKVPLRIGQNMIIYFLSYLAAAWFVYYAGVSMGLGFNKCFKITVNRKKYVQLFTGLIFILVFLFHLFKDERMTGFLQGRSWKSHSGMNYFSSRPFEVTHWDNEYVRQAGAWIRKNIPEGKSFLCNWFQRRMIYFYARGKYPFYNLDPVNIFFGEKYYNSEIYKKLPEGRPLFLLPWNNKKEDVQQLDAFWQEDILAMIRQKKIDYVCTTGYMGFLALYFEQHPGFKKIKEFGQGWIKVYQVIDPAVQNKDIFYTGSAMKVYLLHLKKANSKEYQELKQRIFIQKFLMSETEIRKLEAGQYPEVDINKIY